MATASALQGTPSQLISSIRSTLIAAGWSVPSSVLPMAATKTYNGKSLAFNFETWTNTYLAFTVGGNYYYIYTGATGTTSSGYYLNMSASNGFVWIQVKGPNPGVAEAKDATYGSDMGFFFLTEYEPYWTADSDIANHWCAFSSHSSVNATDWAFRGRIRRGFDGSDWPPVELATVRPAIQDIDTVGDMLPGTYQQNQIIHWDYILVESGTSTPGVRGRLKDVYFAGDSYGSLLSGDSSVASQHRHSSYIGSTLMVENTPCWLVRPFFQPNGSIGQYSPLGTPDKSYLYVMNGINGYGGPLTLIRWE